MSTAAAKSATGAGKDDIDELKPVKPADPDVIEIGKFAVKEHNVQEKTELLFVGVIGGFWWGPPSRPGSAVHYALIIETQDHDTGATYLHKAYVLVRPSVQVSRKLIWYKN